MLTEAIQILYFPALCQYTIINLAISLSLCVHVMVISHGTNIHLYFILGNLV
jgi:hypothetical protein